MERLVYKFAMKFIPVLLPIVNVILWVVVFLLNKSTPIANGLEWLPYAIIQIVISTLLGIWIKKLNFGANNDELTGLYNRRYLNARLAEEIARIKRTQSSLSLILIDADNFKQVNDTYGHLIGDEVLARLGDILRVNTRIIDIAARWGGEEFAIIMPETDLKGAHAFAERLRRTVEDYDFGFQVTISLGIISDCNELSLDELLTKADEALYTAKEQRNRVVAYTKFGYCET